MHDEPEGGEWPAWFVWLMVAICALTLGYMALITQPASGHVPGHAELNAWVSSLHNRNGVLCCDMSDADLLSEPDWGTQNKDGSHFWVRLHIQGEGDVRMDVPDNDVVDGPNRAEHALVWYAFLNGMPYIRCFMPGAMT